MNIIFMRHGEATDNVKELISDKEIYWSVLTDKGINNVLEAINKLPTVIDKIYVSPLPRTIQTAHYVFNKYSKTEFLIENRIREINNGKYSGQVNNEELDKTRCKQIEGDYFIRFGDYGENKFDIESRLCSFLNDVYQSNDKKDTILLISHGSIISYMKRILHIKTPHIKTGEIEEFKNIDFSFLLKYIEKLNTIKMENLDSDEIS
ncbi:MAG: phosphoglycerate mutase family protein [Bacilli bacterium]|nr:phosphoglycerate mutase family protein [Bacilli bacterium]